MLFVLGAIAMNDQFAATLREVRKVMRMMTSVSTSLVGSLALLVVGVTGSPSPPRDHAHRRRASLRDNVTQATPVREHHEETDPHQESSS